MSEIHTSDSINHSTSDDHADYNEVRVHIESDELPIPIINKKHDKKLSKSQQIIMGDSRVFKRNIELKQENFKEEHILESACIRMDKRIFNAGLRLTISLMVLTFSFYQIIQSKPPECPTSDNSLYFSFISLISGYWLSSSDNHKNEKK